MKFFVVVALFAFVAVQVCQSVPIPDGEAKEAAAVQSAPAVPEAAAAPATEAAEVKAADPAVAAPVAAPAKPAETAAVEEKKP